MQTVESVFSSPNEYLFSFEGADATFLPMDRDAYQRSIFLDRRISPLSTSGRRIPISELAAEADARGSSQGLCLILHIAHCGSTLLARALDVRDDNIVFREPLALRQLGVEGAARFGGAPTQEWRERLALCRRLLARRYNQSGPAIVKANVPVNFIVDPLFALDAEQRAIFLHFSLEHYLLAILRSNDHITWLTRVSQDLSGALNALAGPANGMAPPILAARLWLAQMLLYAPALERYPNGVSLDAELFFSTPDEVLSAAFSHFGQPQGADTIANITSGPLFTQYSKDPRRAFRNENRLDLQRNLRQQLATPLAQARDWVRAHSRASELPERLAKPLLGEGRVLVEPV